jgi:hypothetical protein
MRWSLSRHLPLHPLWTDCLSALSLLKDSQDQRPVEQLNLDKCQVGKLLRKIESWHHGSDEEQRAFEKSFAETSFVGTAWLANLLCSGAHHVAPPSRAAIN